MKPSANCYALIRTFEGLRLNSYLDTGNVCTIGYGSTMYRSGKRVKLGEKITELEAEILLQWGIDNKATVINSLLLKVVVNQNQFDALVSFAYNVGLGAFANSTLLKKLVKNPNDVSMRNEFMRWNKDNGRTVEGLTRRRKKESDFYFS